MTRYCRILIMLFLLAVVTSACSPVAPPHPRIASKILFIGNGLSDWNLMNEHLAGLAACANPPKTIETSKIVVRDKRLAYMWNATTALDQIRTGDWDIVVLQEGMAERPDEQAFYEYARKFDEEITKNGAETVLYMTTQYKPGSPWYDVTTDEIARAYNDIGTELGVKVAPVALAWERCIEEDPDLELYEGDGDHPNIAGTYLTISVLYATIFERSPVGLSYNILPDPDSVDPAHKERAQKYRDQHHISEENDEFLQRIAWETVQEYQVEHGATQ